ncbi:ribbon-helix-helix domain-containing protein [Thiomonas sp.]|jgi:metal-responsive CopG/Arc/MetJ family transcriptional regulator|uniref:ribbon-helix-helix domain-containing protein n=1 Tax=Thiomonas sp. TaxID=2047785 RepID=UPI00344E8164
MDRLQINVRLPPELMELLDKRRMELHGSMGKIPSRSEVVRLALEAYLLPTEGKTAVAQKRSAGSNRRSS